MQALKVASRREWLTELGRVAEARTSRGEDPTTTCPQLYINQSIRRATLKAGKEPASIALGVTFRTKVGRS
jgi:hypothetical protein